MKSFISKTIATTVIGVAMAISATAVVSADTVATNAACVDGTKRSNLSVTWNSNSSVTVKTIGDKLLCADTKLYFSSYTMPDNYDGTGFGGPTSYPQQLFKTETTVLKAGTTGKTTLNVAIPEACKNMQIDLYYGPEITTVTAAGHGVQYISGKVLSKTADSCEVPVTPVVPTPEAQTPATPAPEVTVVAPAQTLSNTGTNTGVIAALAAGAVVAGTAAAEFAFARVRR